MRGQLPCPRMAASREQNTAGGGGCGTGSWLSDRSSSSYGQTATSSPWPWSHGGNVTRNAPVAGVASRAIGELLRQTNGLTRAPAPGLIVQLTGSRIAIPPAPRFNCDVNGRGGFGPDRPGRSDAGGGCGRGTRDGGRGRGDGRGGLFRSGRRAGEVRVSDPCATSSWSITLQLVVVGEVVAREVAANMRCVVGVSAKTQARPSGCGRRVTFRGAPHRRADDL